MIGQNFQALKLESKQGLTISGAELPVWVILTQPIQLVTPKMKNY